MNETDVVNCRKCEGINKIRDKKKFGPAEKGVYEGFK